MEIERRGFLGALITAPFTASLSSRQRHLPSIGIQLNSLQREIDSDFERTLDRVAAMGYREVEFAGFAGRSPQQVRTALFNLNNAQRRGVRQA